jgi:hypothetical protein
MPQEVEVPAISPALGLAIAVQSKVIYTEEEGDQQDTDENEFEDEE